MKKSLSLLIICLLLSGCADKITRKLRKADKLMKEAIALGAKVNEDTVYIDRTIVTPARVTTVTIPGLSTLRDTTIIKYQDRIKIQWTIRRDTLYERIECPQDTIKTKTPVSITKTINCPDPPKTWRTVSFVLGGLLLIMLLFAFLTGRLK